MHTLYYSPQSCSLAPHIALEEIGVPYGLELVTATDGRMTDTPAWRAVNPKGRVPALSGVPGTAGGRDGVLTEVHAILLYLAHTHPEARLLPPDPAGQARASEWMIWLASAVHAMAYGQLWRPQRFVADPALFPAVQAKGRETLGGHHAYIERLLADGRDWAVPGGYSVVDAYLLVFWRWAGMFGFDMPADCPAWAVLTRRTAARPAVRRVLDQLGLEVRA
jgi:glutathione S-transferase